MPSMVLTVFSFGCRGRGYLLQHLRARSLCKRGNGSQEVTDFFSQELRLPKLTGKWQKRTLHYLRNRCGHRFLGEGAVCKAQEEISSGEESRCEGLGLQAGDVSLQRAGTQSSALLVMSRSGHPVTSDLRHRPAWLEGINTGPESQRDNSSREMPCQHLSLFPRPAAAASTAEAEVSPAFILREGGNKDPWSSMVWSPCLAPATLRLVSNMAHIPPYGRQEA